MSKPWPTVSLGELIRLERRPVKVEPVKLYQEIGIYCFGRGIFHKTPRTGFEVGDKDLFLMKEGDFILQVTFAWEGAIAIVSAAEDGMYGSTRYPTFRVDESRCDSRFLLNYFKTEEGLQQLIKICPGSAGRNRILSMRRICDMETLQKWECFDSDSGRDIAEEVREYFIPDFSDWRKAERFENAFKKLCRDLRQEGVTTSAA